MSRTHKDQYSRYTSKYYKELRELEYIRVAPFKYIKKPGVRPKKKRFYVEPFTGMYSGAPSWWTRLFMLRPQRRENRVWEREVLFNVELEPHNKFKKPFIYYY